MDIFNRVIQKYLRYDVAFENSRAYVRIDLDGYIKTKTFSNGSFSEKLWLTYMRQYAYNFIVLKAEIGETDTTYHYLNSKEFNSVTPWIPEVEEEDDSAIVDGTTYLCVLTHSYHKSVCEQTSTPKDMNISKLKKFL